MKPLSLAPIGIVHSSRKIADDDHWDFEQAYIALDQSRFAADSLTGLSDFSHVEIVFSMHQVSTEKIETGARHPRGNSEWPKVGIFAQRAKNRPNAIGTTICRLLRIEELNIHLQGLDAIDGTPIIDIKPWVKEFGPRGDVRQPKWIGELMREYWSR